MTENGSQGTDTKPHGALARTNRGTAPSWLPFLAHALGTFLVPLVLLALASYEHPIFLIFVAFPIAVATFAMSIAGSISAYRFDAGRSGTVAAITSLAIAAVLFLALMMRVSEVPRGDSWIAWWALALVLVALHSASAMTITQRAKVPASPEPAGRASTDHNAILATILALEALLLLAYLLFDLGPLPAMSASLQSMMVAAMLVSTGLAVWLWRAPEANTTQAGTVIGAYAVLALLWTAFSMYSALPFEPWGLLWALTNVAKLVAATVARGPSHSA